MNEVISGHKSFLSSGLTEARAHTYVAFLASDLFGKGWKPHNMICFLHSWWAGG